MDVESVDQARATVEQLPLVNEDFAKYEFYPVGPLAPLGMLI